jgi:hypothetical protein
MANIIRPPLALGEAFSRVRGCICRVSCFRWELIKKVGSIDGHMTDSARACRSGSSGQTPLFPAELSRGIARRRLGLYPFVREVLDLLQILGLPGP